MLNTYTVVHCAPTAETFGKLRQLAGLSPRPSGAVSRALAASCYVMHVLCEDEVIGMGRIIGDGALNFEIVDIAVVPAHQGRGVGRLIMQDLMSWLSKHAEVGSYISLIADVPELYRKFGFSSVGPKSEGMSLTWPPL